MGKVLTFTYGIILVLLGLASFWNWLELYLAYIVLCVDILIMLTTIERVFPYGGGRIAPPPRIPFNFFRRWIFPAFMIVMASPNLPILNFIYEWLNSFGWLDLSYIVLGSGSAALILILFGAIYIMEAIRAGRIKATNW